MTMGAFGDRLREARNAVGMSQERLGMELGVTKGAVSGWENNRDFPSFAVLVKLRSAVRQSLDYLMVGPDDVASAEPSMRWAVSEPPSSDSGYVIAPRNKHSLSAREFALVQRYRVMAPRQQQALLDLLRAGGGDG